MSPSKRITPSLFHFPPRGDLQRSVAFEKADIKELGASLLFEE
jgi:hypothetical protein